MDPRTRLGKTGEMSFAAGAGVAASTGRRLRDPRFVYDPRELAEFDLPKLAVSRPTTFLSQTKPKSAGVDALASKASGDSPLAYTEGGGAGGTLPLIHDASKSRFRVTSGTFSAVREAYGVDESKREEAEEIASHILAKTYGQQRSSVTKPSPRRATLTAAAGAPAAGQTTAAKSDEHAAAQALIEVQSLQTGAVILHSFSLTVGDH